MSKPTLLTSMLIPMAILGFSLSSAVNLASGLFRLLRTKTWLSGLSDSGQPFASYSRARPLLAGGSSQPPHTELSSVVVLVCVPGCAAHWDALAPKLPEEAVSKCAGTVSGASTLAFSRADLLLWPCVWHVYDEPKHHAGNYCFHWEKQLGLKQEGRAFPASLSVSTVLLLAAAQWQEACLPRIQGRADLSQHTHRAVQTTTAETMPQPALSVSLVRQSWVLTLVTLSYIVMWGRAQSDSVTDQLLVNHFHHPPSGSPIHITHFCFNLKSVHMVLNLPGEISVSAREASNWKNLQQQTKIHHVLLHNTKMSGTE